MSRIGSEMLDGICFVIIGTIIVKDYLLLKKRVLLELEENGDVHECE